MIKKRYTISVDEGTYLTLKMLKSSENYSSIGQIIRNMLSSELKRRSDLYSSKKKGAS